MAIPNPRLLIAGVVTAAFAAGCTSVDPSPELPAVTPVPPSGASAAASPAFSPDRITLADAEDCPLTQPTTAPPEIGDRLFGSGSAYGNDDLWVGGLGEDGILAVSESYAESDGSVSTKLGWWRNVAGSVEIRGRRLDAPAPAMSGQGSEGYGQIGFQASGVTFPTEGCWEVTGSIGESAITFVTFVDIHPDV